MLRSPLNSIRARLTLGISLAALVLMSTLSVCIVGFARHSEEKGAARALRSGIARVQAEMLEDEHHHQLPRDMEAIYSLLREDHLALMIVAPDGRIVRQSQTSVPAWPLRDEPRWRTRHFTLGSYTVVVSFPWEREEREVQQLTLSLVGVSLIVVLFCGTGAWWLVGRTLSPITRLSEQAQNASVEDLRVRLSPSSHDVEIVNLVGTFNSLLEQMAHTIAMKERFHTAASHELRTPLMALSGHLEVALGRERTAPEYRAAMDEAYRQAQHLTSLTRDLLLLNQLGGTHSNFPSELVDLADICQRTLVHFRPLIEERALTVQTRLCVEKELLAPPTHADMLIRNLIENAVKYASEGGIVQVELDETDHGIRLSIFNSCPPGTLLDSEHVFEPFYRSDESRNSDTGGNGLGLAICKAIANANEWLLALTSSAEGVYVTTYVNGL